MKIETTRHPSHTSLVLRGEFETEAAGAFLATVEQLIEQGQTRINACFRYVKYLNSTALGSVVRARTTCEKQGGDLVITRPSRLSREIVTKMGLDHVLAMFDDEDEGVDYLIGHGGVPDAGEASKAEEQANTVMFTFGDERDELLPGRRKHGVAVLDSVTADGLVFHWNPGDHGCEEAVGPAMFRLGQNVHLKLQIKLARKDFFEAEAPSTTSLATTAAT